MMINITKIDWNDVNKAVPAFITISIMVCAPACCITLHHATQYINLLEHKKQKLHSPAFWMYMFCSMA